MHKVIKSFFLTVTSICSCSFTSYHGNVFLSPLLFKL